MYSGKKRNMIFRKWGGGGIKGRLELFQKFIRFGRAALPLAFQITYQVNFHFCPEQKLGLHYEINVNCFTPYLSVRWRVEQPVDMLKIEAIE